ncbi:MAG TPA: pyridoxal-phosphate dependent enzyme [Bacteroidetes bacterium]|nr:pyridoxal-phosphate dependent enzyme [Bacteroidota bacterium]
MNYKNNILETIGKTPLVKLNKINNGLAPLILTKLESFNPGGSSKDRIAVSMIEEAERLGLLRPGGTIIEPTSGNTGLGLALAGIMRGYKLIFTMPDKMSREKEDVLTAHGATVIRTPTEVDADDPRSYYKVAERLLQEIPNSFSPNQYFNENNPAAHYRSTGPEIWEDTDGKITHFIAGIGTGGTISGVGKYLKEKNPGIQVIGVDTEGSLYEDYFKKRETSVHSYLIEGIGEDFIPPIVNFAAIDDILTVSDRDAFATARELVRKEGIFSGSSAGAAVYAGLQAARNLSENDIVVILLPDSGKNYLSTLYNDAWMTEKGLLEKEPERQPVIA